jgi:regulator of nucleoside diphosphate kinase
MSYHDILITDNDRRRLGTMLEDPRLGRIERSERLHALEVELERASWVDSAVVPRDVITMNSTVDVYDIASGETETYTLVYPEKANVDANRVSVLAPLGMAMLGCRVGDVIAVDTPAGVRRIRIEEIRFQPERAGYHDL